MDLLRRIRGAVIEKQEEMPNHLEEKQQAAGIREKTEELLSAMKVLSLTDQTEKIQEAKLEEYRKNIRLLIYKLDMASTSTQDTRRMDKDLLFLVQHLDKAVRNGCQDTADRVMRGLLYGIGKGHEIISSGDAERTEEIMEERERRLGQYKTIVEYSEKIDEREHSIEQQQKLYAEASEEFKKVYGDVKKKMNDNPYLVEQIDQFGEGVKSIDGEAYDVLVKGREATKLYENLKALKKQMALNETTIISCRQIIRNEENVLTEMSTGVSQEMMDAVVRHEVEFRNQLAELQRQITVLEDLSNRFGDALDEIFSSPLMTDFIINADLEFKDMERQLAMEEAGRQRGIQLQQEQVQFNENTQQLLN